MTHLETSNTRYGQKKGQKSNWQFDSRPLKSRIALISLRANGVRHIVGKLLTRAKTLLQTSSQWEGLYMKLCAPKIAGVPTLGISGLPLGSPGTKCHLGAGPMARHRVYYKGEGGGLPQVQAVLSLVNPSLPMVRPSTKSVRTVHSPTCCLVCAGPCE
jgi:hypothetical protein